MLETVKPLTVRERIQWGVLQGLPHRIATSPSAHHHLQTALELAKPHRYLATILEAGPRDRPAAAFATGRGHAAVVCGHVGDGRADLRPTHAQTRWRPRRTISPAGSWMCSDCCPAD